MDRRSAFQIISACLAVIWTPFTLAAAPVLTRAADGKYVPPPLLPWEDWEMPEGVSDFSVHDNIREVRQYNLSADGFILRWDAKTEHGQYSILCGQPSIAGMNFEDVRLEMRKIAHARLLERLA